MGPQEARLWLAILEACLSPGVHGAPADSLALVAASATPLRDPSPGPRLLRGRTERTAKSCGEAGWADSARTGAVQGDPGRPDPGAAAPGAPDKDTGPAVSLTVQRRHGEAGQAAGHPRNGHHGSRPVAVAAALVLIGRPSDPLPAGSTLVPPARAGATSPGVAGGGAGRAQHSARSSSSPRSVVWRPQRPWLTRRRRRTRRPTSTQRRHPSRLATPRGGPGAWAACENGTPVVLVHPGFPCAENFAEKTRPR